MPIRFSCPSAETLEGFLEQSTTDNITYPELGGTGRPHLPDRYRHARYSVSLGRGDHAFTRGQEALGTWQAHRFVGASLTPKVPPLRVGTTVIVTKAVGPFHVIAPCRIVAVTDNEACFGFAYGTLPGHPETGEEAFHIQRALDGEVTFDIVAFSRPADPLARLGSLLGRAIQSRVNRGYLQGVLQYVSAVGD